MNEDFIKMVSELCDNARKYPKDLDKNLDLIVCACKLYAYWK